MATIVKYKGCNRCGGDLFMERDTGGTYVFCLQCSAIYGHRLVPQVKKIASPKVYAR